MVFCRDEFSTSKGDAKIKKKLFNRIARRKDSAPAEPDEGYEIPPPSAIEPGVPHATENTEGEGYDSHMELELLSADEPSRTDSTNGMDARESDPAPALESLTAPVSGEPADATEPPRAAAPFEEYGLDLEPLEVPEAGESPDEAETSREDGETASGVAEQVVESPDFDPAVLEESEPETIGDAAPEFEEASDAAESAVEGYAPAATEFPEESEMRVIDDAAAEDEEPTAAPGVVETRDTPVPQSEAALYEEYGLDLEPLNETESEATPEEPEPSLHEPSLEDEVAASEAVESVMEASASESEVPQETEPEAPRNLQEKMQDQFDTSLIIKAARKKEVEESLAASVSEESPDEDEPLPENEKPASDAAESVAQVAASETEIPGESEPEPAADITKEAGDPLAAPVLPESPEESPEPSIAENGVFPLVRDSRGAWRPGKGFSRSELLEAGLSLAEAACLHIRVDKRRRNAHPVNVAALEKAKSGV